jgi:hypothetical protein
MENRRIYLEINLKYEDIIGNFNFKEHVISSIVENVLFQLKVKGVDSIRNSIKYLEGYRNDIKVGGIMVVVVFDVKDKTEDEIVVERLESFLDRCLDREDNSRGNFEKEIEKMKGNVSRYM